MWAYSAQNRQNAKIATGNNNYNWRAGTISGHDRCGSFRGSVCVTVSQKWSDVLQTKYLKVDKKVDPGKY